jgi:pyridoxal 5'-phosphate synthase pdxT subunit
VKKVGILALQGDFEAHAKAIRKSGGEPIEVRRASELDSVDGLIIPGGESTTMLKLLEAEKLLDPLKNFAAQKPVFGTCAGAILLAREVSRPAQSSLGLIDISVERNGYGRQLDSRIAKIEIGKDQLEAVFIRAPIIREVGDGVQVLATYQGDPVWVEQGRHMATTFHPELGGSSVVHDHFLRKL